MTDLKDVLAQVSGPGDLAIVLLAGSAGLVVDAGLNVIGFLSPGQVGVTAASTALGLKKAYEQNRRKRFDAATATREAARARETLQLLLAAGLSARRLEIEVDLFERGLGSGEALDAAIDEGLSSYRRYQLEPADG